MTQHLQVFTHGLKIGHSCESELEELMHQIDVMVNNKKAEWEKQVKELEQKLEAKDQEITKTQITLDQKSCEVGILQQKLEGFEKARCEMVQNYEKQLQALKYQLYKLKKSYEKLNYNHRKNPKIEITESSPEHEKSQFEVTRLTQKLEEYKASSEEWERQRMVYRNHLKSLNEQKKSLSEKFYVFQRQSQSYQEQLSSRTQLQDEAITNNEAEIRRLRCQLDISQETIRSNRVIIENLKSTVKEITLSRNSLKDENQQLLQEVKKCQKQCQKMEIQLYEAKRQVQTPDDLLGAVELEQIQIQEQDMEQRKGLLENLLSIQDPKLCTQCKALIEDQVKKNFKLSMSSQDKIENYLQAKESKNPEIQKLKTDISELNAKLEQKNITIATIGDKVSRLERELELNEEESENHQALHLLKGQHESNNASSVNLKSVNERLQINATKEQSLYEMHDQHQQRTDQLLWLHNQNEAQNNTQKHRSFNEESKPKMQDQVTNYNRDIQTLNSQWKFGTGDSGWDNPLESFLMDIDCTEDGSLVLHEKCNIQQDIFMPPETDFSDISSIFAWDQEMGITTLPFTGTSFTSVAEKFLNEENMRAKDFENILNSHIEAMQRNSETTLAKYKSQNRHI